MLFFLGGSSIMRFVKVTRVKIKDAPKEVQKKVRELKHLHPIILNHDDMYYILTPFEDW